MSAFIKKLIEKKQSVQLQKQAEQTVRLYFAWVQSLKEQQDFKNKANTLLPTTNPPNTYSDNRQEYKSLAIESLKTEDFATKKNNEAKGGRLDGSICRLKKYHPCSSLLTCNFEDIYWLAVKKQVAASTQNQAFNELLFFFRHVLGKEFGKVDGVVWAKRKPYIPLVLS